MVRDYIGLRPPPPGSRGITGRLQAEVYARSEVGGSGYGTTHFPSGLPEGKLLGGNKIPRRDLEQMGLRV